MPDSIYRFQIGTWTFASLRDGDTTFDAGAFFPSTAPADRAAALHAFDLVEDALPVSINLLVARSETHCVLVDTGLGRDVGNGEGRLLELLAEAEMAPDAIDVVVITHGHWDHIGGLTDGAGRLHFPAARHVMPRREWTFWTDETELSRLPDMYASWALTHLPPLTDQIDLIEPDALIVPGLCATPASGHTPGQIGLLFEGGEERLLHLADALHHPVQLAQPSWTVSADMSPELAIDTRQALIKRAQTAGTHLFGYHFPYPGLATPA